MSARSVEASREQALLAADSWVVDGGCVRGLAKHRQRFLGNIARQAPKRLEAATEYWSDCMRHLPRSGRWFPRIALHADGTLSWRLRQAPTPRGPVKVRVGDDVTDLRRAPTIKGPDLEMLGRLRARAREDGADEQLLTAPDGSVIEAAYSSLLWWDNGELLVPDRELGLLPGVTADIIIERALELGITVRRVRSGLAQLEGCETWLTSAVHGISPVTAWTSSSYRPGPASRAEPWRRWLNEQATPVRSDPENFNEE